MASFSWIFTPSTSSPVASKSVTQAVTDFFGKDILFNGTTHLAANRDYVTVEGEAALKQSLYLRFMTNPGEFVTRPEFGIGLPLFVKKRLTGSVIDEIRQRILDQLSTDARIEELLDLVITPYTLEDRPGIKVYVKIKALGRELSLPFDFKDL